MIKEIIDKLKLKRKQLQNHQSNNIDIATKPIEDEKEIEIKISKDSNNIYKIEISDYMTIGNYIKKVESSNEYHILDFIYNCVLWNNAKQKVNKGIYYVIVIGDCVYNILYTDESIKIDEITKIKLDEQHQKENITQERAITIDITKNEYHYYSAKHDKTGDTYYIKYYNKYRLFSLGELELTEEETYDEINSVISNLEKINGIQDIIDIALLEEYILKDFTKLKKIDNIIKIRTRN